MAYMVYDSKPCVHLNAAPAPHAASCGSGFTTLFFFNYRSTMSKNELLKYRISIDFYKKEEAKKYC
jgi:hypothetical protein